MKILLLDKDTVRECLFCTIYTLLLIQTDSHCFVRDRSVRALEPFRIPDQPTR